MQFYLIADVINVVNFVNQLKLLQYSCRANCFWHKLLNLKIYFPSHAEKFYQEYLSKKWNNTCHLFTKMSVGLSRLNPSIEDFSDTPFSLTCSGISPIGSASSPTDEPVTKIIS